MSLQNKTGLKVIDVKSSMANNYNGTAVPITNHIILNSNDYPVGAKLTMQACASQNNGNAGQPVIYCKDLAGNTLVTLTLSSVTWPVFTRAESTSFPLQSGLAVYNFLVSSIYEVIAKIQLKVVLP